LSLSTAYGYSNLCVNCHNTANCNMYMHMSLQILLLKFKPIGGFKRGKEGNIIMSHQKWILLLQVYMHLRALLVKFLAVFHVLNLQLLPYFHTSVSFLIKLSSLKLSDQIHMYISGYDYYILYQRSTKCK